MGGLKAYLPATYWLMLIATLAIAGFPLLSGFFSKDEILASAFGRGAEAPVYYLFWALGVLAALLTAFYMMRLIAMTFLGENRTGGEAQAHLHEAPAVMTGPLVVLGVLTVVGGVVNLPAWIGGHHALEAWFEPVLAPAGRIMPAHLPHGTTEYLLIGVAVTVALVGLVWGYRATLARPIPVARAAVPETGFARVLFHKYWVDELYHRVLVRPLVGLSRYVLWRFFDQGVIDGLGVNGSAGLARALGWAGGRLQSGQLGFYVVVFLIGAVWVLHAVSR
jgi:NADH-quinone oxidoreductase subunit L